MIAIGLSMDSFSVSISSGIFLKKIRISEVLKIAGILAIFQGGFTSIGWLLGIKFSELISSIDHWIAFILLTYLGIKMIYESLKNNEEEQESEINSLSLKKIILLGFATSIDALAVGISFAFLQTPILLPAIIITAITLIFSIIGLYIGSKFGKFNKFNVELIGGIILIIIGVKILIEHIFNF